MAFDTAILTGPASPHWRFIAGLQVKTALPHLRFMIGLQGETAEEVAGLAKAMRARCIHVPTAEDVLDIVGTGGDGIGSVNISTGATVIAAAAGAKVAKHGNRSVSSLCGSADVLEVEISPLLTSHGLLLRQ